MTSAPVSEVKAPSEPTVSKGQRRMTWLDCLRLSAGVSMLGLHASSDPNGQPYPAFEIAERAVPVLARSVLYIARTELFLITSLFLLMMSLDRRPRPYVRTLSRQGGKLLVPFLFWTVFYAGWNLIKAGHFGYAGQLVADLQSVQSWAGYLLLGDIKYHMHFLPTLFGLVLMVPLYKAAVRHPWLGLTVFVCLFTRQHVDLFLWSHRADIPAFDFVLRAVKILTYGGYGMVGAAMYGLSKRGFASGQGAVFFPALVFAGGMLFLLKIAHALRILETGNWQFGYAPAFWADYLLPILLFLAVMSQGARRWPEWMARIAPYSFGLYLVHPAFMDLAEIILAQFSPLPWQSFGFKVAFSLCSTVLTIRLIGRSRFLGWTIGMGPLPRLRSLGQLPARFSKPSST